MKAVSYMDSPLGKLKIHAENEYICKISFVTHDDIVETRTQVIEDCIQQLEEYFAGKREQFSIPLHIDGSYFQQEVWKILMEIPFGKTTTYKEIALRVNTPKSSRAVGNANRQNKIPILVPCHRVIGSSGKLTGYAGGLWRKRWLLIHESKNAQQTLALW